MDADSPTAMKKLLVFLDHLQAANIWHRLDRVRDAILVEVCVPGEKWGIEFFGDGHVEVERFRSDGRIGGDEMLETLFREFSD
jgi:hypothetical protein